MLIELEDVASALDRDEVVAHFQPIVELRTGVLTGFEVLARWQSADHGLILPSNFIALAEENGLIEQLSQQIFRKAFLAGAQLPERLTLSVNLSATQLHASTLPIEILELAEAGGFTLDRLIVEITESALMRDLPRVQLIAHKLKAMGCRLSLDDFGTGFSSLRHLQALPFDELKIDRAFVSEMTKKRESRKIVAAIVGLGQSLRLATVAEGVETEEQAQMLLWLGCELGQGYLYGRAGAAEGIAGVIAGEPLMAHPSLTAPGEDWACSNLEALPTLHLAQLQAIYDGAQVGLCFLDRKLRYVSLNRQLAEMNGLPVEAHLGRSIEELYPQWFPIYEPYLRRAMAGEAISGVEFMRPADRSRTDGRRGDRAYLASYQPAWDEADEVIGVSVSLLDVTEKKGPEEPLIDKVRPQESLAEINPEVPWVMDADGNDLQVSSRWVQTTPLGKDRTRNLKWLEAVHPEDLEHTVKTMKESLLTGKSIEVEYRIVGLDGTWRWMRSTGSPRYGASGGITRWYGSVEDIHDRKQQEKASQENWELSGGEHNRRFEGLLD